MEDFPQTKLLRYLYIRPIMLTYISSSWVKSTKTAVRGTACRGRLINPNPEPRKTLPTNSTGTNLNPYMAGLSENPARLFRGHKPFINFISLLVHSEDKASPERKTGVTHDMIRNNCGTCKDRGQETEGTPQSDVCQHTKSESRWIRGRVFHIQTNHLHDNYVNEKPIK